MIPSQVGWQVVHEVSNMSSNWLMVWVVGGCSKSWNLNPPSHPIQILVSSTCQHTFPPKKPLILRLGVNSAKYQCSGLCSLATLGQHVHIPAKASACVVKISGINFADSTPTVSEVWGLVVYGVNEIFQWFLLFLRGDLNIKWHLLFIEYATV